MNTIAVGPFEEVASWVTGGTIVAIDRLNGVVGDVCCKGACRIHMAAVLDREEVLVYLQS